MALANGRVVMRSGEGVRVVDATLTPAELATFFTDDAAFGPAIWSAFGGELEANGIDETAFLAAVDTGADFWSTPLTVSFGLLPK